VLGVPAASEGSDEQEQVMEPNARGSDEEAHGNWRTRGLAAIAERRWLLLTIVLVLAARAWALQPYAVDGESMEPTLYGGERLVVSPLPYAVHPARRGDIVVFHPPHDPDVAYVKRIIGLAGEWVAIRGGVVFVNGVRLDEPYLDGATTSCGGDCAWVVPEGAVFVLGDHRDRSSDSRDFGSVPVDAVVGEVLLVAWPPDGLDVLP
jgi:signal peptidase I